MKTEITCVYDRKTNPGIFSKLSHGVSFYIKSGNDHIMFDLGLFGNYLIRNMRSLKIDPNIITKIVISHGHSDHIGGLRLFLKNRTNNNQIPIYAHTDFTEPKRAYKFGIRLWNAGFYEIDEELETKIRYELSKQSIKVTEFLSTTGEISLEERDDIQNVSNLFVHKVDGKWDLDPVLDNTSMFLKTKEGVVLICGDCHSGLTNTIRKVEKISGDNVVTIIGVIHIIFSKKEKIQQIADKLMTDYKDINFHINHSVGSKVFKILQRELGKERVQYFPVGKKLIFES